MQRIKTHETILNELDEYTLFLRLDRQMPNNLSLDQAIKKLPPPIVLVQIQRLRLC